MSEESDIKPVDTRPLPPDPDQQAEVFQGLWDAQAAADGTAAEPQAQSTEPAEVPEPPPAWHSDFVAMERAERYAEVSRAQKGQQLQEAHAAGLAAQQQLRASVAQVPAQQWQELRASNPAAYAAMLHDIQAREQQIAQHLGAVQAGWQELGAEHLAAEKERALQVMPEWRDPATFASAREEMLTFARKMGFTRDEISNLTDHRQLLALYHASQAGKPQPQKPGVRLTRSTPAGRPAALVAAKNRMKEDPRDDHLVAGYFQKLLDVGA